jgi:PAT family beta-lactamase induction signal transducer AmpG
MLAARRGWFFSYAVMAGLLVIGILAFLLGPEGNGAIQERPLNGARDRIRSSQQVATSPEAPRVDGQAPIKVQGGPMAQQHWLATAVLGPFKDFMRRPYWPAILLFVFGYKLGEAMAGVMAMPLYIALGFSLNEIALISKLVGFAATICGALAGGVVTSRFGVIRALIICGLLQSAGNLFYVLQAVGGHRLDYLGLCVAAENITSGMAGAALVAYLSTLCSPAFTATQYALLSSLTAVGRTLIASFAGLLAEKVGWSLFFASTTLLTVPALLLLVWMTRRSRLAVSESRDRDHQSS